MGGISVVLLAILVMLVFAIVFIIVGIMAIIMFIVATILTILFIVKREERKASGKQLGGKVAIPVILYLISIPILILMGIYIFSFIVTDSNISDNIQYYDSDNHNNSIYYDYDDTDYIYDTI